MNTDEHRLNEPEQKRQSVFICVYLWFILITTLPAFAVAQSLPSSNPATTRIVVPEGPLKITVTAIRGLVQARTAADQKWAKAEVGQVLDEGAELRTGPRSTVQFSIPPAQTITLD